MNIKEKNKSWIRVLLVSLWLPWIFFCLSALGTSVDSSWKAASSVGGFQSVPSAHSAAENAAVLSRLPEAQMGVGFHAGSSRHTVRGQVLRDSPEYRTQDGVRSFGALEPIEQTHQNWSFGAAAPIQFFGQSAGVGLSLSAPGRNLRQFRANTPYEFQSLRYGTLGSQFRAQLGLGVLLAERISLGVSSRISIAANGDADADLVADNPTGRLHMDVGLVAAMGLSGEFRVGENDTLLVSYQQASRPQVTQAIRGRAEIAGVDTIELPAIFRSVLYFEPESWALGWTHHFSQTFSAHLGLEWQRWDDFSPSYAEIEIESVRGTRSTQMPLLNLRNSYQAGLSGRVAWRSLEAIAGYRYRTSPLGSDALASSANLLDANTHILGLGIGYSPFGPGRSKVSVFGQFHQGEEIVVEKQATYIGGPGYGLESRALYVGAQVSTPL